jgi:hypothetical protein
MQLHVARQCANAQSYFPHPSSSTDSMFFASTTSTDTFITLATTTILALDSVPTHDSTISSTHDAMVCIRDSHSKHFSG